MWNLIIFIIYNNLSLMIQNIITNGIYTTQANQLMVLKAQLTVIFSGQKRWINFQAPMT